MRKMTKAVIRECRDNQRRTKIRWNVELSIVNDEGKVILYENRYRKKLGKCDM